MEDQNIIELFFQRNEKAIEVTNEKYGAYCLVVAKHILADRHDSEECVSDTYLKIWNCIPPQRPTYFFAFLAKICRHLAFGRLDWNHAAKRRAEIISLSDEIQLCIPDDFGNDHHQQGHHSKVQQKGEEQGIGTGILRQIGLVDIDEQQTGEEDAEIDAVHLTGQSGGENPFPAAEYANQHHHQHGKYHAKSNDKIIQNQPSKLTKNGAAVNSIVTYPTNSARASGKKRQIIDF